MFVMTHYVLAFALITMPGKPQLYFQPFTYAKPVEYKATKNLKIACQFASVNLELIHPTDDWFASSKLDFILSINYMRRIYPVLVDAPPINDERLFPEYFMINSWRCFNESYQKVLDVNKCFWPSRRFNGNCLARQDLKNIQDTLDEALRVKSPWNNMYQKRSGLKELRIRLGYDNYYHGRLPQPVPDYLLYQW